MRQSLFLLQKRLQPQRLLRPGQALEEAARALRDGATDGVDTLGRGLVERGLSIPPRLTLRPGLTFRIILNRDLDLVPYGD